MHQIQQLIKASEKVEDGDVNGVFEISLKFVVTGAFSKEELVSLDEEGLRDILGGLTHESYQQIHIADAIEIGELLVIRDNMTDETITVESEVEPEKEKPKGRAFADRLAEYLAGDDKCPFCGNRNVDYGSGDFGTEAGQDASCPDCDAHWTDAYKMTHIVVHDAGSSGVTDDEINASARIYVAVTGRIPFDDKDTTHVFCVADINEATRLFEEVMYEVEPEGRREEVIKENGLAVFLTNILVSDTEIREEGRPI